jgi:hypothetical protein
MIRQWRDENPDWDRSNKENVAFLNAAAPDMD